MRTVRLTRGAAAVAVLAIAACGGGEGTSDPIPPKKVIPPAGATETMVAQGESIFNGGSCRACHGFSGKNGPYGPDLTDNVWLQIDGSYGAIITLVTTGVPAAKFKSPTSRAEFEMFARGGQNLSDDQVKAVAAYVWTLSHPNG